MVTERTRPEHTEPRGFARFVPLLGWAPQYERRWLRADLIAGLTVTALVVPKALGYAGIARVPIHTVCTPRPPARSCTRSLGRRARSRPDRALRWRPLPAALSFSPACPARRTRCHSSWRSPS